MYYSNQEQYVKGGPAVEYADVPLQRVLGAKQNFVEWISLRREMAPVLVTMMLMALFVNPVVAGIRLAQDPSVIYFVGRWGWWCLAVHPLIWLSWFLQQRKGRPQWNITLMGTIAPSVIVICVGYTHFFKVMHLSNIFESQSCSSGTLNHAYQTAATAFDDCVTRVAGVTGYTPQVASELIDLEDCMEYKNNGHADEYQKEWVFLRDIERTQYCSGWCSAGELALWTRVHARGDLCSRAAGIVLESTVARVGQRMMYSGIAILVFCIIAVHTVSKWMVALDIDW